MALRIVTQPAVEPVSLAQMRLALRLDDDFTADDTLIASLIAAARQQAELLTHRALVTQTLELTLTDFEGGIVELPRPPLQSVTYVKYVDGDSVLATLDAADYQLSLYDEPARLAPARGSAWPYTQGSTFDAVQIRYVAGYAPGAGSPTDYAANVPEAIKQWIKAKVATMYEHRELFVVGQTINAVPRGFIDGLLDRYCVSVVA